MSDLKAWEIALPPVESAVVAAATRGRAKHLAALDAHDAGYYATVQDAFMACTARRSPRNDRRAITRGHEGFFATIPRDDTDMEDS